MPGITLRSAHLQDAPQIRELAHRFLEHGLPPWRDADKARAFHTREAEAVLRALAEGETVLVAESEGQVVGFLYLKTEADFLTGEAQAYLADVAVREDFEGRGAGRALLEAAEAWARAQGHRVLALEVFAANSRARAFYARMGFLEQTLKLVKPLSVD